jgi:hypothetical protein
MAPGIGRRQAGLTEENEEDIPVGSPTTHGKEKVYGSIP